MIKNNGRGKSIKNFLIRKKIPYPLKNKEKIKIREEGKW